MFSLPLASCHVKGLIFGLQVSSCHVKGLVIHCPFKCTVVIWKAVFFFCVVFFLFSSGQLPCKRLCNALSFKCPVVIWKAVLLSSSVRLPYKRPGPSLSFKVASCQLRGCVIVFLHCPFPLATWNAFSLSFIVQLPCKHCKCFLAVSIYQGKLSFKWQFVIWKIMFFPCRCPVTIWKFT